MSSERLLEFDLRVHDNFTFFKIFKKLILARISPVNFSLKLYGGAHFH